MAVTWGYGPCEGPDTVEWVVRAKDLKEIFEGNMKLVERVVRCRDCEWWRETNGWSEKPSCELTATDCDGDFYCACGERREE